MLCSRIILYLCLLLHCRRWWLCSLMLNRVKDPRCLHRVDKKWVEFLKFCEVYGFSKLCLRGLREQRIFLRAPNNKLFAWTGRLFCLAWAAGISQAYHEYKAGISVRNCSRNQCRSSQGLCKILRSHCLQIRAKILHIIEVSAYLEVISGCSLYSQEYFRFILL